MEQEIFDLLFNCRKMIEDTLLSIPDQGSQRKYQAKNIDDENESFSLVINRKGHLNKNTLTYLSSSRFGVMVRLDMRGAPHNDVETPHVHIFDEIHNNGRDAIHLSKLTDITILEDIYDSLSFFLEYNNFEEIDIDTTLF